MPVRGERYDFSTLRILQHLDSHAEQGVTGYKLRHYRGQTYWPGKKPLIDAKQMLPDLVEAGLVEQRAVPHNTITKPYFITEAGRRYLAEAQQSAMSTEPGQRQDWVASLNQPNTQDKVAAFLRQQPEFRDNEVRVQEVSQQLAAALSQGNDRSR